MFASMRGLACTGLSLCDGAHVCMQPQQWASCREVAAGASHRPQTALVLMGRQRMASTEALTEHSRDA